MMIDLKQLEQTAEARFLKAESLDDLENVYKDYFNKKTGQITAITKTLGNLKPEERGPAGKLLNEIKTNLSQKYEEQKQKLKQGVLDSDNFVLDVTLPPEVVLGREVAQGAIHPITQTIREIESIFSHLGFVRRSYPELETDYYAFEALNMPPEHPARAEWETFYTENNMVITPHTSNGQIREMERGELPIRMINIARCGRRQEDPSHTPSFYQFEGLVVDKQVAISDLKGVINYFVRNFFGEDTVTRLRPYNFRFTEPSFEIDITCTVCQGKGCRTCKEGWLELGGAGMVHPDVLRAGKLDPKDVRGFAFGWGVERVLMMRSSIADIRDLYRNDIRFLKEF